MYNFGYKYIYVFVSKINRDLGLDSLMGQVLADVAEIVAEVVVRDFAGTIAHHGSDGGAQPWHHGSDGGACCSSTSSTGNLTEPKLEEGSHGVCLEPVLVRAPRVRVDYKEHSAVIRAKSEESEVKLVVVSTRTELMRWIYVLGDEHLVHVRSGVPIDVVVYQSVLFLAGPKTAADLAPFNGFRSRSHRIIFHQPSVPQPKSVQQVAGVLSEFGPIV